MSVHQLPRRIFGSLAIAGLLALGGMIALGRSGPTTYTAEYQALYKGRHVGTTEFSVQYDPSSGRYVYKSQTQAKGLLKLASPNPVIDRSQFLVDAGMIRPLEFWHEDGSRKGEDNEHIAFDWDAGKAMLSDEDGTVEIELTDGLQDRGSLQPALMSALSDGKTLDRFDVADGNSVRTYVYTPLGTQSVETALGTLEVVRYEQQREGSSRKTIIDFAPELGYVPVRLEQFRDGESLSAFVIESIDRS